MSTPSFLSRVEDTFAITGRGVVVVPGIPQDGKKYFVLIGDPLEIRKPDGEKLLTTVEGIEMFGSPQKTSIPILIPRDVDRQDVPIGSELWHTPRRKTA